MTITLRVAEANTIAVRFSNTGKDKDETFYIGRLVSNEFKESKLTVEKNTSRNLFLTYKGTFEDAETLIKLLRLRYCMRLTTDKLIY